MATVVIFRHVLGVRIDFIDADDSVDTAVDALRPGEGPPLIWRHARDPQAKALAAIGAIAMPLLRLGFPSCTDQDSPHPDLSSGPVGDPRRDLLT